MAISFSPLPNPSVIETYSDYSSQDPSFKGLLALDLAEFSKVNFFVFINSTKSHGHRKLGDILMLTLDSQIDKI